MVYRAMKLAALAVLCCLLTAQAAHGQSVAQRPRIFYGNTVSGTANAQTVTTDKGFTNNPMDIVCAYFAVANTAGATLAVDGQPALTVDVQIPGALINLAGGELVGYQCLQVNANGTGFVLGGIAGGITVNPVSHPVTAAEWSYGQTFVCTAACSLTFPAASTLANQGGINLATVGVQATLTPNSTDQINPAQIGGSATGGAAMTFPADTDSYVTVSGTNALWVALGPLKTKTFNWLPGMDLSLATHGFGIERFDVISVLYQVICVNEILSTAGSMSFYQQAANAAIDGGTLIGSSFDMTANLTTEASPVATPIVVSANRWLGAKVTGSSTAGQGRCHVLYR